MWRWVFTPPMAGLCTTRGGEYIYSPLAQMLVVCSHLIIGYFPHGIEPPQIHTYICLSAQSIVHLTAQIQDMETRVANFFGGAEDLILVQLTLLIQKITKKHLRAHFYENHQKCTAMHHSALQCNVLVTGPQWLKHDPK